MSVPENATRWPGNRQLADAVAPSLESVGIHCVTIVGERVPNSSVEGKQLAFTMDGKDAHWTKESASSLIAVFPFEITVTSTKDGEAKEALAHFFFQYLLSYKMSAPLETWDDLAIESFVAVYGATHAWPYVRADLQALSVKVGVPALTLPVLRAGSFPAGFSISQTKPQPVGDDASDSESS